MAYFNICPDCGCSLDPGEKCDCQREAEKRQEVFNRCIRTEAKTGQAAFVFRGVENEERRSRGAVRL
jgi:hypothetical protein